MNVLLVSVSGGLGGAERALVECVTALRRLHPDWRVHVLGLEGGPLGDELSRVGVGFEVLELPERFARLGEFGRSSMATAAGLASSAPALVSYAAQLRAAIARHDPDVVHSNGFKAHVLTAWTAGAERPLLWHVHDFIGRRRVSSWLLRRYRQRPAVVIANSRAVADDVRRVLGEGTEVEVVYNGIDLGRFSPDGPRADLDALAGLPPAPVGTTRVGLVATYARWKGHDVFLQAIAGLPATSPVRAYIIGGTQYQTAGSQRTRAELMSLAEALGLGGRVGFVDFQRDTAPVYRVLDVVAHTSTEPEPFGLSIVEAMACGRAVTVSHAGGAAEIAAACPEAATFPPGDASALTTLLCRLIADPSLRRVLGTAGRAAVERHFSRDAMGTALSTLYRRVSESRSLASTR
jgi:glycosyltransferase involved in cell wall biosynthesis